MTEKQNYMMLLRGEQPEWLPVSRFGPSSTGAPPATKGVPSSFLMRHQVKPGKADDIWGVTYVPVPEAAGGKIPEPNNYILTDIRKWRDVIKAPDISNVDFETIAKNDLKNADVNRDETAVNLLTFNGFFMHLVSFMGFTEAFYAMCDEPEEVKALMEYLCDFYLDVLEKSIDFYNPDIYAMCDENASYNSPFYSLEVYRDLFKPFNVRIAKPVIDRGIPIDMHDCGRCEDFISDWMDFGVTSWNPAQTSNDIMAVKKKFGNKLVIVGGWEPLGELARDDVTEEEVKESVYRTIDKYAPGGGYVFAGGYMGPIGDENVKMKNKWVSEAAESYARDFYKK